MKSLTLIASGTVLDAKQLNAATPTTYQKTPEGTAKYTGSHASANCLNIQSTFRAANRCSRRVAGFVHLLAGLRAQPEPKFSLISALINPPGGK